MVRLELTFDCFTDNCVNLEVTLFYTNTLLWNIEQSVIFIYTALPTELSLHKIKDIIE